MKIYDYEILSKNKMFKVTLTKNRGYRQKDRTEETPFFNKIRSDKNPIGLYGKGEKLNLPDETNRLRMDRLNESIK